MPFDSYETLEPARLDKVKRAFTTRRVPVENMTQLKVVNWTPAPGDLMLARIETIGQHTRIELTHGRRSTMFPGDEIIVCCSSRYAPDQFHAELQDGVWPRDLVAGGGVASTELNRHNRMKPSTKLIPLGAVCGPDGRPLNVADFAVEAGGATQPIKAILVAGTAMNAGKTSAAAALVRGFKARGYRVGACKITGTGSGGDPWLMVDSGAHAVLDFTDGGYASTFKVPVGDLEAMTHRLIDRLAAEGCEVAVLEVADGLLQEETAALLAAKSFRLRMHGALFTAYDAMGAINGAQWLQQQGYRLFGLGGRMTTSPLAVSEAKAATDLPVHSLAELEQGGVAESMLSDQGVQTQAS